MAFCVVQHTDDPKTQAAIRCWCRHLWIKPTATYWYVMKTSSIQQNILSSHLCNVPFMINIVPSLSTPTHAFACRPSRRRAAWLRAGTRRPLCNGGPCRTMWVEEQQARSETTTWVVIVSVGKGLGRMKLLSDQRSQKVEVQVKMCQIKIATLTVSLGPRKLEMLIDNHGYLQKMLHTTLLCCWCCKKSQEPIDSKKSAQPGAVMLDVGSQDHPAALQPWRNIQRTWWVGRFQQPTAAEEPPPNKKTQQLK